jgi:heterodisulfide reductase subunit A
MMVEQKIGAVLVVGGGVAGVQAALDIASSGFRVYLIDQSSSIGGVMAQLDKTFPTNDCSMCILAPKLVEVGRHPNVALITNAEIAGLTGDLGNFEVKITKKSRYINEEKCNGCGLCAQKCLIEAVDTYNRGLGDRSAIYIDYPQAVPLKYMIDREKCIGCGICEGICKAGAVEYEQKASEVTLKVGSIILAPGFEIFDAKIKTEYGYGRFPNVLTSMEFERMLNASGPYGGVILRPSDGEIPRKIAFIQCVGSRDAQLGNNYCSAACCMYSIKEAVVAREHVPTELCSKIFYMDIRAHGKEFDAYYNRAQDEYGVEFVRSRVASVEEDPLTNNVFVHYVEDEEPRTEEFDMVVLSVGMRPPANVEKLAKVLGIKLNKYDFCQTEAFSPVETSRPGIFVCGAFANPKDIPESVAEASAAAAKAMGLIASERGKLVTIKEYPAERDVSEEEPRIGVFVCHCGINIGGTVNVPEVAEYAKKLPNVVYAENNLYTCSADTQVKIRQKIEELRLNRVVVASCTPRTHEPLFRATCQEAGLNPYLFEMANIRDQCSWVHMHNPEEATEKAKDLIESMVAKVRLLKPLKRPLTSVTPVGLVIGGGISGMTAATELARQGFEVHLVEREKELGGNARHICYELEHENPQEMLKSIVEEVCNDKKIHVHLNSEITNVDGYVGNFKTTFLSSGRKEQVDHGIIIVATGATEYKPTEHFYEVDPRVLTQRELEERLAKGKLNAKTVVMIQCVGSRNATHPNCSRICCSQAVKNALKIKELNSATEVYVLYKDIRTYGFREDYYREAASKGVLFLCFDSKHEPQTSLKEGNLLVEAWEPVLKNWIPIEADLLVLSAATIANPDNDRLAKMLKVPLTKDGFFLEAHMKLRPLDFATDGIFLCGMAHWPKFIDESVSQACGAAARASIILSKKTLEAEGIVSSVDENLCVGCGLCIAICPYSAMEKDEKGLAKVNEVLCKGCGTCAASCPKRAITMRQFTDEQIMAQGIAILRRAAHG